MANGLVGCGGLDPGEANQTPGANPIVFSNTVVSKKTLLKSAYLYPADGMTGSHYPAAVLPSNDN